MAEGVLKGRTVEIAGVVGLIASLGFVGMEIRQNTVAVRAATIKAVSDQAMELSLTIATDEGLSELVGRMRNEGVVRGDLEQRDNQRLAEVVAAGFRRMENVFLQVRAGILDEAALRRVGIGFYANPFGRELWRGFARTTTPLL